MTKSGFTAVVAAGAAWMTATGAFAYDGKVTFAQGKVSVVRQGQASDAPQGTAVSPGEGIRTGEGATAIVTMEDGALLKLNESSEITVPAGPGHEIALGAGGVFSQVPKQKPGTHFMIRTRSATMGVRGTRFFTAFGKEREAGQDLWMCVNEGSVEVTSLADRKQVLVKQGEGVMLPAGKGITPPKKYEWTRHLNWNMDPRRGEVKDKTQIDYSKEMLTQDYD